MNKETDKRTIKNQLYEMVLDGRKDSGVEVTVFNTLSIGVPLLIGGVLAVLSSYLYHIEE
jgi:hypothetical protein